MGLIQNKLKSVGTYLMSITRNSSEGWYEIEIGLPFSWVIKETNKISCEIVESNDKFKIVCVSPKKDSDIVVDDLIDFLSHVVETNQRVEDKKNELATFLEAEKAALEEKMKKYYDELETIRQSSFSELNNMDDFNSEPDQSENNEHPVKRIYKKKQAEETKEDNATEE